MFVLKMSMALWVMLIFLLSMQCYGRALTSRSRNSEDSEYNVRPPVKHPQLKQDLSKPFAPLSTGSKTEEDKDYEPLVFFTKTKKQANIDNHKN